MRPPRIHHCTSEPFRFFGREEELRLLNEALAGGPTSVIAFVGPGGQGKTAIVQHWLGELLASQPGASPRTIELRPFGAPVFSPEGAQHDSPGQRPGEVAALRCASRLTECAGLFLWSFYRGKDADLCLRELYAYAANLDRLPDVSASYCVDHLLPILRRERWALVLDGTEVAQHDSGSWRGRFLHPELGRLLEELASEPMPGVVALTSRFELPTLASRFHARLISLASLDRLSARSLLGSLGVTGSESELDAVAEAGGRHAKAVELLGTYLKRFHGGAARCLSELPDVPRAEGASDEEHQVERVLTAYRTALPVEAQDLIALATAFRDPPTPARLLDYLTSQPVTELLHRTWKRDYLPFGERQPGWLANQLRELIDLRLLERVGRGEAADATAAVIDAHPLVRRGFESVLGVRGQRQSATARAGFLRGRPNRQRPETLEQAREEVELFHAYCDAGLWNEADSAYRALDNPKHRFLAPALERDLLVRFFPGGDWRQPPLWPGFGRYRSLAICLEMLGDFEDALDCYRGPDSPLRGDALLALGQLEPLLQQPFAPAPWQTLWQAYRCHALSLAGRTEEAVNLARSLVPLDVYESLHVFEGLRRAGRLDLFDPRSLEAKPAGGEHRWAELARRRMWADYRLVREPGADLTGEYQELVEAYDRAGLPLERAQTRLSYAALLLDRKDAPGAEGVLRAALALATTHRMRIVEADARCLLGKPGSFSTVEVG